jgi:hypothetical protein
MLVAGLSGQFGPQATSTLEYDGRVLKIAPVYIRREYRYGLSALIRSLERALQQALNLSDEHEQDRPWPRLDTTTEDRPAAFAAWLADYRNRRPERPPLLVCLDGIDELPHRPDQVSILDYLPAPADLPDGIYLLLTSRLGGADDRCPDLVWQPARERLTSGGPFLAIDLDTGEPGYQALLRGYFHRELAGVWESTAEQAFAQWLDAPPAQRAGDTTGGSPPTDLAGLRDRRGKRLDRRLDDCWSRCLTGAACRSTSCSAWSARSNRRRTVRSRPHGSAMRCSRSSRCSVPGAPMWGVTTAFVSASRV